MRGHSELDVSGLASTRVLLAESSRIFAEALMSAMDLDPVLEPIGYALDGWEALALVESLRPDIVVVGPELEGLDGRTLVWLLTELWPRVRVLVLGNEEAGLDDAAASLPLDRSTDELMEAITDVSPPRPRLVLVGAASAAEVHRG